MREKGPFRIQAVAALTGVPEATLRAWERRYHVPTPLRTSSGYRLYSQQDVELIRRMRELCAAGMAPADAAKSLASGARAPAKLPGGPYETLARRIVEATRRMDPLSLEAEIRLAMTLADAPTIVEQIFCPALTEIGRDWERGTISVGHEHLAADVLTAATRDMLRLVAPPRPVAEAVLACFAEEDHSLPLYAAAFRFVEWGVRTHLLGARTPPAALGAAVQELKPAFVGLSVTIAPPAHRASELLAAYADVIGARPWAVGGAAAHELKPLIKARGGHVLEGVSHETRDPLGRLLGRR